MAVDPVVEQVLLAAAATLVISDCTEEANSLPETGRLDGLVGALTAELLPQPVGEEGLPRAGSLSWKRRRSTLMLPTTRMSGLDIDPVPDDLEVGGERDDRAGRDELVERVDALHDQPDAQCRQ